MRVKALACVAFGFLPFVSFGRVGPVVSFWPEWTAALLFLILTIVMIWRAKGGVDINLRPVGLLALGLGGLLMFQVALGMVHSLSAAMIALWVLGLIFLLDGVVVPALQDEQWAVGFDYVSLGVLFALVYHLALSIMGLFGCDLVYFDILPMDVPARAFGAFGQPNQLAVFSVLACWAASRLYMRRKLSGWLLSAVYVAATLLLVISFSRAGILCAAVLGIMLCIRSVWLSTEEGKIIRVLGVAFVGMAVAAIVLSEPARIAIETLHPEGISGVRFADRGTSNQSRIEQAVDGLAMGWSHPLLGVGYRRYAEVRFFDLRGALSESNVVYPHNLLIHLFAEFGFVGVFLVLGVFFWALRGGIRHREVCGVGGLGNFLMGCLLVLCLYSMVEFPLMYLFFLLPFVFCASLLTRGVAVPKVRFHVARPTLFLGVAVLSFGLVWSVWDYIRIRSVYDYLLSRDSVESGVVKQEAIQRVAGLSESSLFQYQAATLWLAVAGVNPVFVNEKVAVARYLMTAAPVSSTIARYVGLLLLARRDGEAVEMLRILRGRNGELTDDVLQELRTMSRSTPDLRVSMVRNGLLPSASAASVFVSPP